MRQQQNDINKQRSFVSNILVCIVVLTCETNFIAKQMQQKNAKNTSITVFQPRSQTLWTRLTVFH